MIYLTYLILLCVNYSSISSKYYQKNQDILTKLLVYKNGTYNLKGCSYKNLSCYGLSENYINNKELAKNHTDFDSVQKLSQIVEEYKFAFAKYKKHSFGYDEFQPLTENGRMFSKFGIGYFIVDVVDTAILMGLKDEVELCFNYIMNKLSFHQDASVNVFETTIRVLGGLLSSYFLTNYQYTEILNISLDLGERLLKAFNNSTGINIPTINLLLGNYVYYEKTSTAEATSIQLEFKLLSFLTKNLKFWNISEIGMETINKEFNKKHKIDGLVPITIDSVTGEFEGNEIRLGSRGDSYYEYILKQYLLTQFEQPKYLQRYQETVDGIKKHLVGYSVSNSSLFVGEILAYEPTDLIPKMDHLVCFLPGMLAIGATKGYSLVEIEIINTYLDKDKIKVNYNDLELAERIMETCYKMYSMHPTGLAAEITKFYTEKNKPVGDKFNDMYVTKFDKHCLLRPETVESLFIMYRITQNETYREWGWNIFENIKKYAKTEHGYCSIKDVSQIPTQKINKMETFFLAETLKYLYLLFSNKDFLPLHQVVFNTEAHPFPRFKLEQLINEKRNQKATHTKIIKQLSTLSHVGNNI